MAAIEGDGYRLWATEGEWFSPFVRGLARLAREGGLEISSCAEARDLAAHGIPPGKCVDHALIRAAFGITVSGRKDPAQRDACCCVASRDIGVYDTCPCGCRYCYATTSSELVSANRARHDLYGTALVANYGADETTSVK